LRPAPSVIRAMRFLGLLLKLEILDVKKWGVSISN
jgi:hypothetical protein